VDYYLAGDSLRLSRSRWLAGTTRRNDRAGRGSIAVHSGPAVHRSVQQPRSNCAGDASLPPLPRDTRSHRWSYRTAAARRFFTRALRHGPVPVEVTTDKAAPYLRVLDGLVPAARHITERYANNRIEADHSRLKARLRPMRGLKRFRSAARLAAGHAFVQNLRRGHYELATDVSPPLRLATAFSELALAV
jgi:hypothetical protein